MLEEKNIKPWWEEKWYEEWMELSKKRKKDFKKPSGYWGCYFDSSSGKIQYKYIELWKEI